MNLNNCIDVRSKAKFVIIILLMAEVSSCASTRLRYSDDYHSSPKLDWACEVDDDSLALYTSSFNDGMADIYKNGKNGFVNNKGELVIGPIFDSVSSFEKGLAVVELDGKSGLIDRQGRVVVDIMYDTLLKWGDYYTVKLGNSAYYSIDASGKKVSDAIASASRDEHERLANKSGIKSFSKALLHNSSLNQKAPLTPE